MEYLVEKITFTNPLTGQPVTFNRSQPIPAGADTILAIAKSLGLSENLQGTWQLEVSTSPTGAA